MNQPGLEPVPATIMLIIAQDYLNIKYSLESLLYLLGDLRKRRGSVTNTAQYSQCQVHSAV